MAQQTLEGDEKLSTDVTVGGKKIQLVSDTENVESVLGWMGIYTIGPSFTVDRGWLEDRANELGIPAHMLPSEVSSKRAFTRACKRLPNLTPGILPQDVTISTSRVDYNTFNLEVTDRRGDGIKSDLMGVLQYDEGNVYTRAKTGNGEKIEWFQSYSQLFKETFDLMGRSNLGKDIRKMIREFCLDHSTSVKMRDAGAVYFIPAQYTDMAKALQTLVDDIDVHWKKEGFECSLDLIEVIDSPGKRGMVEAKVQKSLSSTVEGIVEEAVEMFDEERATNEVVSKLSKELASAESLAVEHNTLLNAEMSVKKALTEWKGSVKDDQQEIIDKLVDEVEV